MATKKLWSQLADSTKKRYRRHGVTPAIYNSPVKRKENAALLQTAMGKAPKSYAQQRAESLGLKELVPHWNTLPRAEQRKATDLYLQGLFTRNRGTIPGSDFTRDFDLGTEFNPVLDKWTALESTVATRMDFMEFLDEHGGSMDTEEWKIFRELYRQAF